MVEIEFGWGITEQLKKVDEAMYARALPVLREEIVGVDWPDSMEEKKNFYLNRTRHMVDLGRVGPVLSAMAITFEVKRFKGNAWGVRHRDEPDVDRQGNPQGVFNLTVHVSDGNLLNFDEVALAEDACTDAIQAALNEGWRVMAICPAIDSRRPTFILGRGIRQRDGNERRRSDQAERL